MARHSLLRKYLIIFTSILVMTFLSVYLIQRTFEKKPDNPLVSDGSSIDEGLVTLASQSEPATLDPTKQESTIEHMLCSVLYQPLFEEAGGSVVPSDLIEWVGVDNNAVIIDLNPSKLFHSGRRVGAEDVKYSIERTIRKSENESTRIVSLLPALEGLDDFLAGKSPEIEGIQIVDDNTVRIEWKEDTEDLKRILSFPEFSILEKTTLLQVNNYGSSFSNREEPTINGTGPYRIVAWDEQFLALEPLAADEQNKTSRMEICFEENLDSILYGLRLNEYDAALADLAIGEEEDFFPSESLGWQTLSTGHVLYLKTGVSSETALENALVLGLDRSELREALGWERVLDSSNELSFGQGETDMYYENPEIAKSSWALVQEEQVELSIGYVPSPIMENAAKVLQENYSKLGIPVRMATFETEGLMEEALQTGAIQAYIDSYYDDAGLYRNGAYLHVDSSDIEAGAKYVPLLQNELYYRFAEPGDSSPELSRLLGQ